MKELSHADVISFLLERIAIIEAREDVLLQVLFNDPKFKSDYDKIINDESIKKDLAEFYSNRINKEYDNLRK